MLPSPKKLFFGLGILILASAFLLVRQIKVARTITVTPVSAPLVSPDAIALPTTPADPLFGNPGAPMTLVVFGDLSDSKTRSLLTTVINFVSQHPTAARLIFKSTPEEHLWGGALTAHEALWCASSTQAFWPLLQSFLTAPNVNENALAGTATSLHMSDTQLLSCVRLPATKQAILNETAIAQNNGLTVFPALFVNNKQINLSEGVDIEQMLTSFIQP